MVDLQSKNQVIEALVKLYRDRLETDGLFGTRDASKVLGVSEATVKRWGDIGELKCIRTVTGRRRFTADSILAKQITIQALLDKREAQEA